MAHSVTLMNHSDLRPEESLVTKRLLFNYIFGLEKDIMSFYKLHLPTQSRINYLHNHVQISFAKRHL